MCPLPELNLNLGITGNPISSSEKDGDKIVMRTDSMLKKHTITLIISDHEVGMIQLRINNKEIGIPTYKLTVTDDKTNETQAYQVTRDTLSFVETKTKKSILSFLGFKRFDKTSFLYENISFEPNLEEIERFDISKYRSLTTNDLTYRFSKNGQNIMLYAGDINKFEKPSEVLQYFIVADNNNGQSFIGDILFRDKFLKLTPKVELHIIRRNKVPKNFEFDDKGNVSKLIYI